MFNITNGSIVDPGSLLTATNNATNGYLISLFTIVIFVVIMVALLRFGFLKAIVSSSFAVFFISLLFSFADLLNPLFVLAYLIILAFSAFALYLTEE